MGEFELIQRYFEQSANALSTAAGVVLGIGDDGALLQVPAGTQLVVSSDMLVEGRHFFPDVAPCALGHKALAVNLSDLAAMGARPLGFTLALSLPEVNEAWLEGFSSGLMALAAEARCPLLGGDTTKGPLNLCLTIFGTVEPGQSLRRDAAQIEDDIWVSGWPGEARAALGRLRGEAWADDLIRSPHWPSLRNRLERPEPRLALGQALAGVAHAAVDVSDGLASDLGHVLSRSRAGALLELDALPVREGLRMLQPEARRECLLNGGDDYELLFTAPPDMRSRVQAIALQCQTPVARIGVITGAASGLRLREADGSVRTLTAHGFDHFGEPSDRGG